MIWNYKGSLRNGSLMGKVNFPSRTFDKCLIFDHLGAADNIFREKCISGKTEDISSKKFYLAFLP